MEDEPTYPLEINGNAFEANRENLFLYTFFGRVAVRGIEMDATEINHVFVQVGEEQGEEEDRMMGAYLFMSNPHHMELYAKLATFIVDNNFQMLLNRIDVPQCDIDAWERATFADLGSFIPDGWDEPRS